VRRGSPDIDHDVVVGICQTGSRTLISAKGTHDAFPAYEFLVNGKVIYAYYPTDTGPTPWNLALLSVSFKKGTAL
jgi:hypothetical protein